MEHNQLYSVARLPVIFNNECKDSRHFFFQKNVILLKNEIVFTFPGQQNTSGYTPFHPLSREK